MSCCCIAELDYCKIVSCLGKLSLGVNATIAGEYQLRVEFLGVMQIVRKNFEVGENLEFNVSLLNENYVFVGKVYNPAGVQITKTVDETVYECFRFETVFAYGITGAEGLTVGTMKLTFSDFDEEGRYVGDISENIVGIYHTGKANYLTASEWQYIYDAGQIIGLQLLIPIDTEDILYIF